MSKEGRMLILGIGKGLNYDVLRPGEEWWRENSFNASVVVPEANLFADCRQSQSKQNKLFTYQISKARESGLNIVLLAPTVEMLDKRLLPGAETIQW